MPPRDPSGQATWPTPLPPARIVWRTQGPFARDVPSPTRTIPRWVPAVTLRCRTAADVTVRLERRVGSTWRHWFTMTGREMSCRVDPRGQPFRLWIDGGMVEGWIDLIATRW